MTRALVIDLGAVAGVLLVCAGLAWIWAPLGLIALGGSMAGTAVLAARAGRGAPGRREEEE